MLQPDDNPKRNKPNFASEYLRYHFSFYKRFWYVFGGVFLFDQLTKVATLQWLPQTTTTTVIPGFFNLVHVYNDGAAFSILRGYRWPFVLLALGALAGIFYFRRHLELQRRSHQWIFGMLTGGIFGNALDRTFHGKVIDFLDFDLPLYGHWPAFNIADCGICIGAVAYILLNFWETKAAANAATAGTRQSPNPDASAAPRRDQPAPPP